MVKADGYGHGAVDVAGAALGEGALALCVATVAEALPLRREFQGARILVLGPSTERDVAQAREADLDLAVFDEPIPEGVRVHLKLDTGMGRWGLSELPAPAVNVVGLMSHLATADSDPAFARTPDRALRGGDGRPAERDPAHREQRGGAADPRVAPRRRALRGRPLRDVALRRAAGRGRARAGAALGELRRARFGSWRPVRARGTGRVFVAREPTWIGLVPVGYADGFRRDLTGTRVHVDGRALPRRRRGLDGRVRDRARP